MGLKNNIINKNKGLIVNWLFALILIFLSIVSLNHVTALWSISNTYTYAVILASCTAILLSLTIVTQHLSKYAVLFFIFIISIEFFGNIYDAFINIDLTNQNFTDWKVLMEPVFSIFYDTKLSDNFYRRTIAVINGSFIPLLMSLVLHYWLSIRKKLNKWDNKSSDNIKPKKVKSNFIFSIDKQEAKVSNNNNNNNNNIPDVPILISDEHKKDDYKSYQLDTNSVERFLKINGNKSIEKINQEGSDENKTQDKRKIKLNPHIVGGNSLKTKR